MLPNKMMDELHARRIAVLCADFCQSYSLYCKALSHYHLHAKRTLPAVIFDDLTVEGTHEKEIEKFTITAKNTVSIMKAWIKTDNEDPELKYALAYNLTLTRATMIKTAEVIYGYFEERNDSIRELTQVYAGDQLGLIESLIPPVVEGLAEDLKESNDYGVTFS